MGLEFIDKELTGLEKLDVNWNQMIGGVKTKWEFGDVSQKGNKFLYAE